MAGKTGVYICTGCDIGSAADVEALQKLVADELKVPACKAHPFLCSEDGVNLLKGELQREGLDRLVLGACSSRYHKETFDFGKQTLIARAPLREYVAWTQPHQTEDTQMMAADYLRMHVTAIKMQETPVPFQQQTEKTLLVVGGGVTGMTAALEAARTGYPVHMVEQEPRLGGFALKLHRRIPSASPFHAAQSAAPDELARATEGHRGITVHKSSRVVSISGQHGDFTVTLTGSAGETTVHVGAIVLATCGKPYDAQDCEPSCTSNATVQAHQIIQAVMFGKDAVILLSPISLYRRVGSPRSGSSVDDNFEESTRIGILPLDDQRNRERGIEGLHPHNGYSTRPPDNWESFAGEFRFDEVLEIKSRPEFETALLLGFPVVYGRQGHCICSVDVDIDSRGRRVYPYANSWGDWGDEGFGVDSQSQIEMGADWAFAPRSIIVLKYMLKAA